MHSTLGDSVIPFAPLVLAQLPGVSNSDLLTGILVLVAIAVIFNHLVAAWRNLTGKGATTWRSLDDCRGIHAKLTSAIEVSESKRDAWRDDITSRLNEAVLELKAEDEAHCAKLHERINAVVATLCELKGTVTASMRTKG